jgi:hypothetical protein
MDETASLKEAVFLSNKKHIIYKNHKETEG